LSTRPKLGISCNMQRWHYGGRQHNCSTLCYSPNVHIRTPISNNYGAHINGSTSALFRANETNFQQDDGDCKSTSTTEQNTGQLPPSDDRFSPMHPRVCDSSLPDDLLLISLSREAERREEETRTLELSGSQEDDVGRRCTYGRSALRFDASSNTVCTGVYSATVNNTASCEANASFPPAFRLILNFKYFKVYLFATEQKQDKLFVTAK